MISFRRLLLVGLGVIMIREPLALGATGNPDIGPLLDSHNVSWDVPGPTSAQSMPIGNGENGLQQMLMQTDGKKIMLLPGWPNGWDADFKLNAPYNTTVQGSIVQGKLTNLVVTPPERKADVVDMSLASALSPSNGRQVANK